MKTKPIYNQIVEVAENLIQSQGYHAFSYRDIAELVGIKTSSIHYYFPTKADLVKAVVKQHIDGLCTYLDEVINDNQTSYSEKLTLFFEGVFSKTYLSSRKMCLGGMLAADVLTLPDSVQYEVRVFFNRLEEKLIHLLTEGAKAHQFKIQKSIKKEVQLILSLLEGALLLSRLYHDSKRLDLIKATVLDRLT